MKFFEKYYPYIVTAMVAICCLLLFQINCSGQTYNFSQKNGKAINLGSVTVADPYTISFNYTADDSVHYYPTGGVIFCEVGGNRIYIQYPELRFVTQWNDHGVVKDDVASFDLTGVVSYSRLTDKKSHRVTIRKTATLKELLIDSVIIGRIATKPQTTFTANIWLGSDRVDYKLSGKIETFVFSPIYVVLRSEVPQPKGTIDSLEYPIGYVPNSNNWTPVPDAVTQLKMMATPNFHKKSTIERNSLCVELKYLAGYDPNVTNDYNKISLNGKTIATDLALKFNCGFRTPSNINSWYSDYTKRDYCFDCAIMDTAAYYPNIRKDWGSALVQSNNIPPYIAAELDQATVTTPLSYFAGTRNIFKIQCDTLKAVYQRKDISVDSLLFWEDREGLPFWGGIAGTTTFNNDYDYMLSLGLTNFPNVRKTGYDIYSMWFWNEGGMVWPNVLDFTNTRKGTISVYTESQWAWNTKTGGNIRGSMFYDFSKYAELSTGNTMNTPFVSPGWNATVEKNMQPSNWCGMLGIYLVEGVEYFFPAFFTINSSGVQNPKGYAYIPAMPAYVQACVSNPVYWNVIKNGTLLKGTTQATADYNQWSGRVTIKTVAKKLGTEYIIATTNQKENVYEYPRSRKVEFNCRIDGYLLPIFSRPQATIWYFNSANRIEAGVNPKMIAGSIFRGSPTRWKSANVNMED